MIHFTTIHPGNIYEMDIRAETFFIKVDHIHQERDRITVHYHVFNDREPRTAPLAEFAFNAREIF